MLEHRISYAKCSVQAETTNLYLDTSHSTHNLKPQVGHTYSGAGVSFRKLLKGNALLHLTKVPGPSVPSNTRANKGIPILIFVGSTDSVM
jgi:hypothetical protein